MLKKKMILTVLTIFLITGLFGFTGVNTAKAETSEETEASALAACTNVSLTIFEQNLQTGKVVFIVKSNPGNTVKFDITKFGTDEVVASSYLNATNGTSTVTEYFKPGFYYASAYQYSPCAGNSNGIQFGM